ncbi:MAG: hypothetical protein ACYDH9_16590 [Limisphaerales bacterium]
MSNHNVLLNVSLQDLRKAIALKERIGELQSEVQGLLGGADIVKPTPAAGKRTMSPAARARIAAAQKARWAKIRSGKRQASKAPAKQKRKMSPAARAKLAAIAKARWAKVKKSGGKSL